MTRHHQIEDELLYRRSPPSNATIDIYTAVPNRPVVKGGMVPCDEPFTPGVIETISIDNLDFGAWLPRSATRRMLQQHHYWPGLRLGQIGFGPDLGFGPMLLLHGHVGPPRGVEDAVLEIANWYGLEPPAIMERMGGRSIEFVMPGNHLNIFLLEETCQITSFSDVRDVNATFDLAAEGGPEAALNFIREQIASLKIATERQR